MMKLKERLALEFVQHFEDMGKKEGLWVEIPLAAAYLAGFEKAREMAASQISGIERDGAWFTPMGEQLRLIGEEEV